MPHLRGERHSWWFNWIIIRKRHNCIKKTTFTAIREIKVSMPCEFGTITIQNYENIYKNRRGKQVINVILYHTEQHKWSKLAQQN